MTTVTTPVELLAHAALPAAWAAIASESLALTRLEPQSVSGDPRPGAEALIGDPLWMLGRQWQFGELLGEDVGSPVAVHVSQRSLPITAWAPVGKESAKPEWHPWPEGAILDELVEHVPRAGAQRGLRWRAETGAQLSEMLHEGGHSDAAEALLEAHPLTLLLDPGDPEADLDPAALRLFSALDGTTPDGGTARDALVAAEPAWITGAADPAGAAQVAARWLAWFDGQAGAGGAWLTERLEHRFLLRFGHGELAFVLRAASFGQGSARWHHFEWLDDASVQLESDAELHAAVPTSNILLATPLRYPGMPADRYWQLEEGAVDVSAIEAQPHDLARLCFAEFALVSGDDWLLVPVDSAHGAINRVERVSVTTTFGEQVEIAEAFAERRERGFQMFEVTSRSGRTLPGVVLPPTAATALMGESLEEIAFIRDETANMAWAVERVVPGPSGDARWRSAEPPPARPTPPDDADPSDLIYQLQTPIPAHWIPLVPVRLQPGVIGLRKGALLHEGVPVLPRGELLAPTPLTFPSEEIPREGITVRAVPALARRADGSYARWTRHLISTGRGEASSGLASDEARPMRKQKRP